MSPTNDTMLKYYGTLNHEACLAEIKEKEPWKSCAASTKVGGTAVSCTPFIKDKAILAVLPSLPW